VRGQVVRGHGDVFLRLQLHQPLPRCALVQEPLEDGAFRLKELDKEDFHVPKIIVGHVRVNAEDLEHPLYYFERLSLHCKAKRRLSALVCYESILYEI